MLKKQILCRYDVIFQTFNFLIKNSERYFSIYSYSFYTSLTHTLTHTHTCSTSDSRRHD